MTAKKNKEIIKEVKKVVKEEVKMKEEKKSKKEVKKEYPKGLPTFVSSDNFHLHLNSRDDLTNEQKRDIFNKIGPSQSRPGNVERQDF